MVPTTSPGWRYPLRRVLGPVVLLWNGDGVVPPPPPRKDRTKLTIMGWRWGTALSGKDMGLVEVKVLWNGDGVSPQPLNRHTPVKTCITRAVIKKLTKIFVIVGRFIDLDGSQIDNDAKILLQNLKNITVRWYYLVLRWHLEIN